MSTIDKNIAWLIRNKEILKINRIEKKLSMPQGTLKKYVENERGLDKSWHSSVIDYIKTIRK